MKRKAAISIFMAAALCFAAFAAGCQTTAPTPTAQPAATPEQQAAAEEQPTAAPEQQAETSAPADESIRVALVSGLMGDKSYNDSCMEGAQRAVADFGVDLTVLEGASAVEHESNFLAAASGGYDLVICASSDFQEYLIEHHTAFPDVKFAIIDTVVEGPNVVSISFAQNQGSFLAGAAAAMWTTQTEIPGVNEDKIIGWVGGMDIPVLHDFFTGYEYGAKYIDPDIEIFQAFAGSWNDPLKGKELTLGFYEMGADIVMNVASGTGNGVLEAAAEADRYAIGVDLNQDNDQPGAVLTSMLKRVDNACYLLIESVVKSTFQGGSTEYLDIVKGGVSLTDFSVMKAHLGGVFPDDILDRIAELEQKVISGEIIVPNFTGFGPR